MDNEATAAIINGQESVNALKMITNGSPDPTVAAHLHNIHHSFSLLHSFLDFLKSKSLKKKRYGEEGKEEDGSVYRIIDSPSPILDDGLLWRKYGQKTINGFPYQRSYYRCGNAKDSNCNAKKQVQQIQDNPSLFRTTFIGQHLCQTAINLCPTNDINNSTTMIQFKIQDQTMSETNYIENPQIQEHQNIKLHDNVSAETDNPVVVDDDFDFFFNLEKFWSDHELACLANRDISQE